MKSPTKGRPRLTFADLAEIHCDACDKDKPAAGSKKFRALIICAECVGKINQRVAEKGAQGDAHGNVKA